MIESEVENGLIKWFTAHNIPAWLNRKSKYCDKVFKTKGTQKKPDIIILSNNPKINGYVAIEVKPSEKNRTIYGSGKIIRYAKEYETGETEYFIDDKKIEIKLFIAATELAIQGKIIEGDEIRDNEHKTHPDFEYLKSRDFLRITWSFWRDLRLDNSKVGIGLLLSSKLDRNFESNYSPKVFCQIYSDGRWNLQWTQL